MKRSVFFLIMSILVAMNTTALGFSWTFGYFDHATAPFDNNNNTAPIEYPYGVGYLPSPGILGEGGERFDEEGFFVDFDSDYMYLALTNSFGMSATSTSTGSNFRQGDIFFGYGGAQNTYAIDVSSGELVAVNSWDYIGADPGSYFDHTAIKLRVGAFEVTDGDPLGSAGQSLTLWEGLETDPLSLPDDTNGDTYVFEWKIERSLLGWDGFSDIFFHTTLGCGNDLIEYNYSGIPEPGTMILLGIGLFGTGLMARRKFK